MAQCKVWLEVERVLDPEESAGNGQCKVGLPVQLNVCTTEDEAQTFVKRVTTLLAVADGIHLNAPGPG